MDDTASANGQPQDVAMRMAEHDRLIHTLGIALDMVGPGRAVTRMTVAEAHLNSFDMGHGAAIYALADAAFSYACNADNVRAVAARCTIDYLAPTQAGDLLCATAQRTAEAGRTGVYDVTVTNQRDETVALFRGVARKIGGPVTAFA